MNAKGGDFSHWWNFVTDTVRVVRFVKQMKRQLPRRKAEMDDDDDDVFGLWDDQSSDECFTSDNKHDNEDNNGGDDACRPAAQHSRQTQRGTLQEGPQVLIGVRRQGVHST